jgi:hypothetical protein
MCEIAGSSKGEIRKHYDFSIPIPKDRKQSPVLSRKTDKAEINRKWRMEIWNLSSSSDFAMT